MQFFLFLPIAYVNAVEGLVQDKMVKLTEVSSKGIINISHTFYQDVQVLHIHYIVITEP